MFEVKKFLTVLYVMNICRGYLAHFGEVHEVGNDAPNCTALFWLKPWQIGCCWGSYDCW